MVCVFVIVCCVLCVLCVCVDVCVSLCVCALWYIHTFNPDPLFTHTNTHTGEATPLHPHVGVFVTMNPGACLSVLPVCLFVCL
jgi:hypothetical protein